MENSNQEYAKNKKDTYTLRIVISILLMVVLLIGELYVMINDSANYIALIVLAVVIVADVYVLIASAIQQSYKRELDRYEQYDNLFKSEKASYLIVRKSFEEVQERLDRIEEASGVPTEEIINAQKSIAKVSINRNKENTDALMNSNDKLIEKLFSLEDILDNNNAQMLAKQQEVIENANKDLIMKQQEMISSLRELELSIKNEILSAASRIQTAQPQVVMSTVPQPAVTMPPLKEEEDTPVQVKPSIEEEDTIALENFAKTLASQGDEAANESMTAEASIDEELPDLDALFAAEEATDVNQNAASEESENTSHSITPEESADVNQNIAPEEPADANHMMTPEEIAALIAKTNEVEEPVIKAAVFEEPPVEEITEEIAKEESVIEDKPEMPDLSDPNKMMTPEEIAALFANA